MNPAPAPKFDNAEAALAPVRVNVVPLVIPARLVAPAPETSSAVSNVFAVASVCRKFNKPAAVVGVVTLLFKVSVTPTPGPGDTAIVGNALSPRFDVFTVNTVLFSATPNRAVPIRSTAAPAELKSVTVDAERKPPSCPAS